MLIAAIAFSAFRASQGEAPQAFTELVPSAIGIEPGKPFQIALHMKMAPGWHSYFINPGESGMATKIKWTLPPGFTAGPIRWPAPTRIVFDSVAGFVYENEVWLVSDITPPAKPWDSMRPPAILADVSWLLCKAICVPQKAHLSMPVYEEFSDKPNPAFAPALRSLPKGQGSLPLSASVSGKVVTLNLDKSGVKASGIRFFPGDATYFAADIPKVSATKTGIKLEIPLSPYAPSLPKRLDGILVLPVSDGPGGGAHWIDVQVTKR